MKKCLGKGILSVFLALIYLSLSANRAYSQAVVTDTQSTGKTIKQWFTEVQESKTVVSTMQTVQKTSTAIGTAKKSVSEYVIKNKEKIEEKVAKVKEYKEKAEKYKKEYEQYKKQLDENIAKAKELKEQAEAGIETAKETAAAAKDAAGSAIDAAKDKAGGAIDAAKDKAGISSEEKQSENTSSSAATAEILAENAQAAAKNEGELANKAETPETSTAETPPTSSRTPFGTGTEGEESSVTNNEMSSILTKEEQETFNKLESKGTLSAEETLKLNALKEKMSQIQANSSEIKISPAVSNVPTTVRDIMPQESTSANVSQPNVTTVKEAPATAVTKPAITAPKEGIQLRKAFTTSSLHQSEPLMFAKVEMLNLPDGGTDANGTVIIPKALAMYCGLNSGDALEAGKIDECLLRLNKERQSAQLFSGSDAPKVYNLAMAQYVAASMAEAYKARQDADSFEENFIDAVDFASEPTAQDVYDNIVELNKAIDMQMNGLLRVLSTQLAVQSFYNYGGYRFVPAEADGEGNE